MRIAGAILFTVVVVITVMVMFSPRSRLSRLSNTDRNLASVAALEPVRIQIGGEPSTLDPAKVLDQYGFSILRNLVMGLTVMDQSGTLQNGVAESYRIDQTGLIYRFKLRQDALWSDGRTVTIEDFICGLRYALSPKTASPNTPYFFAIKNAKEVFAGKAGPEALGVRREGDELVIELEKPDPSLLMALTLPAAGPLRQDFLDANKGEWNEKAPTTGDYVIEAYHPASEIKLAPNPVRTRPGQRPILYRVLTEEVTAMNLFESKRLDVITTITATELGRLRKKGLIQTFPSTTVFYFSFNYSAPPFNDPDWRKAIASSIDREGLGKILNGIYVPTTSYVPKPLDGVLEYQPLDFPESVAKVKALASKSRVRLAYGASVFTKTVAEKTQNDLQKKLGLNIVLEPMELKSLLARLKSDPPEMYFLGMSGMYDDPINHLGAFSNIAEPTFSRYHNPEYERLVEIVRTTPLGPERTAAAEAANRQLIEKDVVVVPAVVRLQVFGVNRELTDFKVNPFQVIGLSAIRK